MWHRQPYPRTRILLEGNNQPQDTSGKNAMSASYCFLTCSILGNTSFSSRIHLNCVITTIPHLKMGRRPPKVYCCSKIKGRKGQAYSSNSITIFKVFSCLTINITPETNNEHSDKTLEVSVSSQRKAVFSGVKKCSEKEKQDQNNSENTTRPLYQTDPLQGIKEKTSL